MYKYLVYQNSCYLNLYNSLKEQCMWKSNWISTQENNQLPHSISLKKDPGKNILPTSTGRKSELATLQGDTLSEILFKIPKTFFYNVIY